MKSGFDTLFLKLNLSDYTKLAELLNEACALGIEYARIAGKCGNVGIYVYIHVSLQDLECSVKTLGMVIEVLKTAGVDDTILLLLKYSNTIVEGGDTALFYIDPGFTLGVFYMVCKHTNVEWIKHEYVEPEELEYFSKGV